MGLRALTLILTQDQWTHRRAETVSLEEHGETRQRISWDFTIPEELAIPMGADRVAVPLGILAKQPLKRLDITDASGTALPLWGTRQNGALAASALASGLEGVLGREPNDGELRLLDKIVFASDEAGGLPFWYALEVRLEQAQAKNPIAIPSLLALAYDLLSQFLLVVELPREIVGRRTLVKMSHESELGDRERYPMLATRHTTFFFGAPWQSVGSWHMELQAPQGLAVKQLSAHSWDADEDADKPRELSVSGPTGTTAHISGATTTGEGALNWAQLEVRPARAGLVNQTLVGTIMATLLLCAGVAWPGELFAAVEDPNRGSAVAAVMLAIPAVLITQLSRGAEHGLVSRLLLLPRLLNFLTALLLLSAAAALVLGLDENVLTCTIRILAVAQACLMVAATVVFGRSVGGST